MKPVPYARQSIDQEDVDAVIEVLKSDFLTQGPAVQKFEEAVKEYCGSRYAVAVSSATAALHLGCLAAGLKPGKRLWTSPNTFVASANCALYCGAKVDFVDIDPQTYNMSVSALEEKLESASNTGLLPDIIVPVHFAGQSCEMDRIHELSKRYGFVIIEDASHAIGGSFKGTKVGACEFSDMTVLSFHPVKIITTGEGGMILTNNKQLYERLVRLRSHGIVRDQAQMTQNSHGPWYYEQIDLGYNYRLTDIQAVLGSSQLKKIDQFVTRRREVADRYNLLLSDMPVKCPHQNSNVFSAFHLYPILLNLKEIRKTRREVFLSLHAQGILVNVHYIPVHLQPCYRELGFRKGQFPNAECYYGRAVSLPMYYELSDQDQDRVVMALRMAVA